VQGLSILAGCPAEAKTENRRLPRLLWIIWPQRRSVASILVVIPPANGALHRLTKAFAAASAKGYGLQTAKLAKGPSPMAIKNFTAAQNYAELRTQTGPHPEGIRRAGLGVSLPYLNQMEK